MLNFLDDGQGMTQGKQAVLQLSVSLLFPSCSVFAHLLTQCIHCGAGVYCVRCHTG